MKKTIIIGSMLLLSIALTGCNEKTNEHQEYKSEEGILDDVEIIDNRMIVFFNSSSITDDFVFRKYILWDYIALKNHIGDHIRIDYILWYTDIDNVLKDSWLEYVNYQVLTLE